MSNKTTTHNQTASQSQSQTQTQVEDAPPLLKLRADQNEDTKERKHVQWEGDVIDNEHLNKKKSKSMYL